MHSKRIFSVALLVIAAGCTHPTSVTPPQYGKVPFLSAGWASSNYSATFEIHKTTLTSIDSSSGPMEDATATLWDTTDTGPVSGGTVTINGTSLAVNDHTSTGGGEYYDLDMARGQTVPIAFDGSTCKFSVSGSSKFAALTDSITFPNRDMSVTSPVIGTNVSKSAGLTITWSYNSGSTDSVFISITGDSTGNTSYFVQDNGSYTVPSGDLSAFTVGERALVSVTRVCYKVAQDSYGRWYAMAAYASDQKYHMVVN